MIFPKFRATAGVAILCGVCLFLTGRLFAQAPPGPLPPSQPLPPPKTGATPKKATGGRSEKNACGILEAECRPER